MARSARAPTLNERPTIERATEEPNGRGGRVTVWQPLEKTPTVWAEVIGLTGDEAIAAGAARSVQRWRITIRLRRDLLTTDRLRWRGLVIDVTSLVPSQDRRWLVIIGESGIKS